MSKMESIVGSKVGEDEETINKSKMETYLENIYLKKTNYKIINNREIQENELKEEPTGSF